MKLKFETIVDTETVVRAFMTREDPTIWVLDHAENGALTELPAELTAAVTISVELRELGKRDAYFDVEVTGPPDVIRQVNDLNCRYQGMILEDPAEREEADKNLIYQSGEGPASLPPLVTMLGPVSLRGEWSVFCQEEDDQPDLVAYCESVAAIVRLSGVDCRVERGASTTRVHVLFEVERVEDEPKLKRAWELFHDLVEEHSVWSI